MMKKINEIYRQRRDALIKLVQQDHHAFTGPILLFAPCETPNHVFAQESNFFYFSGLQEPAMVMQLSDQQQIVYQPDYSALRRTWVTSHMSVAQENQVELRFDQVQTTGKQADVMHIYPYFDFATYQHIIDLITNALARQEKIFTIYPMSSSESWNIRMVIDRLALVIPTLQENIVDISEQVAQLRRVKDMHEIETLYKAVEITTQAHFTAVSVLKAGNKESDLQAALEYVFTENLAKPAYPSIVATGLNGTVLHYHANNQKFADGDLVVVDAGAQYQQYCADITRTYPVSGKFTQEQQAMYELVLECQELVAEHAKPGMWLFNKENQEMSLHHIAMSFFKKHGVDQYFTHGIGHFLGLDVHDVGNRSKALQQGDVITIEPGLYIPEKKMAIRIEDNYWIVDQATPVCLSEGLPKTIKGVEEMIEQALHVDLE